MPFARFLCSLRGGLDSRIAINYRQDMVADKTIPRYGHDIRDAVTYPPTSTLFRHLSYFLSTHHFLLIGGQAISLSIG